MDLRYPIPFPLRFLALVLSAGLVGVGALAAEEKSSDPSGIDAFVTHYFKVWSDGDFEAYGATFHPRATIRFLTDAGGVSLSLKDAFVRAQAAGQSDGRLDEVPTSIRVLSRHGQRALVEASWLLTYPDGTPPKTGIDWFTLVRTPQGWQIVDLTFWNDPPRPSARSEAPATGSEFPS